MVTAVKHEWHQHDRQYAVEIDEDLLSEIYPDLDEDEIAAMLKQIENGEIDVEEVIDEAYENNVEIYWEFQYDDCWTDRKGGYEVTYELGDENSYHSEPEEPPATHKCTKCRWEGKKWESRTVYVNEQGDILPDDCEDCHDTKDGCPMCDSDITLTESGKQEEEARAKRMAEIDTMFADEEEPVDEEELEADLEELKREFDTLVDSVVVVSMKCTKCEWTGDWTDTETGEDSEDMCPKCGAPVEDTQDE